MIHFYTLFILKKIPLFRNVHGQRHLIEALQNKNKNYETSSQDNIIVILAKF